MLLAWLFAIGTWIEAVETLGLPGRHRDGVPAGMQFFFAIVLTCAAIGDVRMTFVPDWMRSIPVILVLAAGPLVLLVYWMWRVRLRQNLRGIMTRNPIAPATPHSP
jgi:hypothetical protein